MSKWTVGDVMTTDVVSVPLDAGYRTVVDTLMQNRISAVPVVDDFRRVVGVVSEADLLRKERGELADFPDRELDELAGLYEAKGLSPGTARQVAEELTVRAAFAAHADAELHIDPDDLTNPWRQRHRLTADAETVNGVVPWVHVEIPPGLGRKSLF